MGNIKGGADNISGALSTVNDKLRAIVDGDVSDRCWKRAYHVGDRCVGVLPTHCASEDEFWGGFCHAGGYVWNEHHLRARTAMCDPDSECPNFDAGFCGVPVPPEYELIAGIAW